MISSCKTRTKYDMVEGILQEENYVNLNSTIDHRYLDGALAAKMQREVINKNKILILR